MLGIGLLAAGIAIVLSTRLAKAATRKLAAALEAEGFTAVLEPTDDQRAATLEGMSPLALFESPGTLHWFAWRKIDGIKLPAVVLQHSHIVGSGKYAREHFRTLVAGPVAQAKPEIWMRRPKAGIYNLQGTATAPDVLVGDEKFDAALLVQCPGDATAPRRLLTQKVREFILAGPKRESWVLARGYACCIFHNDIAAEGLRVMLSRARRMAEMWKQ
ncbi:hypothetical protein BH09PLA1_BH09PLA1_04340 [soil metagenome]